MTTNSPTSNPLWIFEKAVLAHAPEFDVACIARLRISHDQNDEQGSISIRVNATLLEFGKQSLMLSIRPEMVDTCTVVAKSNDKLIPDRMFSMVPVSVTTSAAVSTLVLSLNTTGVVLLPPSVEGAILSSARPSDANFEDFAKICQSTILHLHLSKQQLKDGDLHHLRTFSGALRTRVLKAQPFDYKRLNAGHGAIERDWRVFEQVLDPPPYCGSARSVLGKRARDCSSAERSRPASVASGSPPPPPWSPTEINTPTTCSPSPSHISRTKFTYDTTQSYKQRLKALELQRQLIGLPDELVRDALAGSGHNHLLIPVTPAVPGQLLKAKNLLYNEQRGSRTSADMEEADLVARVDTIIEQRLTKLTKDAFKIHTQRRLHALVESQLPVAADLFLNGAVADYRDQFYQECQTNEANIREHIDEGITEVRDVTNDCTKEISELAQQCMDSLDEHSKGLDASAEQELSKLKRWFAELAQSLLNDKRVDFDPQSTVRTRRSSV
ncbi:hypothetical protein E4T39_06337 [Aureobasidium subglaciale]|nr:hypothetical protein E4T39_06337 [Aureobasidium subglaciale]